MSGIALVISDVDGTLVTSRKTMTERTRNAIASLHARRIGFTIVSSRPVFGLRWLVDSLALALPFAAFNGGVLATRERTVLQRRTIGRDAAREAIAFLRGRGTEVWFFSDEEWWATDPHGPYVERETTTVQKPPRIADDLDSLAASAIKIVGVSDDFVRLTEVEHAARAAFAGRATIARSQRYYLDFVAPGIDKGFAVRELARTLGVALAETVTLGDMENDVPMFRNSGFSIAMGNASDAVKAEAHATTLANDEDGFAAAVERIILPRAGRA